MPDTTTTTTPASTWLGWALAGAFAVVIIFLLMRGTAPTAAYQADLLKLDTLQKENASLRAAAAVKDSIASETQLASQSQVDSLKLMDAVNKATISGMGAQNVSLAKQVKYYKAHKDTVSYDSACDLLAERVPVQDSIIRQQQVNSDSLTATLSRIITNLDSAHNADLSLIASDKQLIGAQSAVIKKVTASDQASTKRSKLNRTLSRIGGAGCAGAGVAAIVLGSNPIGLAAIGVGAVVIILAR